MASALEQELFLRLNGDAGRMAEVLRAAHNEGIEVALPYSPLMDLLNRVVRKPGGDILGAARLVIRAHVYASSLDGNALQASHDSSKKSCARRISEVVRAGDGERLLPPPLKYLRLIKGQYPCP
jgi:hypothetical protein